MSEPFIIMPSSEVAALVQNAVAACVEIVKQQHEPEPSLTVQKFAKLHAVSQETVRQWISDGMPKFKACDVRGTRIFPSSARAWLEKNRG